MAKSKVQPEPIPEHFPDLEAAGAFWDTHDLADYADQTTEIAATITIQRRQHLVALAPEIAERIAAEAQRRGLSSETLINLWLSERLERPAA